MMTLDAIRTAMVSTDPYDRMDAMVRAELATGRTVQSLIDAFNPLIDDALETPGLTRDGRAAFLGTLDRLTGDCDPEQHYHDRPPTAGGGYTVTFPDPATERRGLGFLLGRFSGQVRSNGVHVIPREALAALADQKITFTVVGE